MKRKRVVVLGATGSIGESALKVARDIPERMEIVGLAANSNAEKLAAQPTWCARKRFAWSMKRSSTILREALDYEAADFFGRDGLREIACLTNADMVLVAIVGTGGLRPALAAIEAGKDLAVASKEILVMAGEIVMREAARKAASGFCRSIASTTRFFSASTANVQSQRTLRRIDPYRIGRTIPRNADERF